MKKALQKFEFASVATFCLLVLPIMAIAQQEVKHGLSLYPAIPPLERAPYVGETVPESEGDCNVLSFEGIGNQSRIGKVGGSVTVTFGASWLGLIDAEAGGSGNFANEPSPNTIAFFLDTNDISITLEPAVKLVEFDYVASQISLPITISAFDSDGNLVDIATGNVVGTDFDGAPCSGDPSGDFCRWDKVSLASTSNNIQNIVIEGTIANQFGINDLRFCIGQCGLGQDEILKPIDIPDSCSPSNEASCKERRDFAGDSQADCLLSEIVSEENEKLQLWCIKGPRFGCGPFGLFRCLDDYMLFYSSPKVPTPTRVGLCPYEGGRNRGHVVFAESPDDSNDQPDCFIRTFWRSEDRGFRDDDGDGVVDWKEFQYDIISNNLEFRAFESQDGPGGDDPDVAAITDPQLGPETEALFDELLEQLRSQEPGAPMDADPFKLCDIDRDGDCDQMDSDRLEAAIGMCAGDPDYNAAADLNGDGCVTVQDQRLLEGLAIPVNIDIKPGSDPSAINPGSKGVIPVVILTTDTFDATTVDPLSVKFGPGGALEAHGRGHIEDADGDGDDDLVLHFNTQDTGIICGDASASLTGETFDGTPIEGSDSIATVGCP